MKSIKFKKIWEDYDSMLLLEMTASNGRHMTTQDFYIYPNYFMSFAQKLEQFFPKLGIGEVVLEYGSEDKEKNANAYLLCRATYKNLGLLNLEFRTNNNEEGDEVAKSHFFMDITNQELNDLGKALVAWCGDMDNDFEYEWAGSS